VKPITEALVLVSYGGHGIVQLESGSRIRCKYRRQVGRPYCGDRVRIELTDGDSGVVEFIHPRKNTFVRADQQQRKHTVAANLDQVVVVIANRPLPSRDLVERYLLAVHSLGIKPIIVLNKVDLVDIDRNGAGAQVLAHLDDYRSLGYTVIRTSCKSEPGIRDLSPALAGKTSILAGQSGVGKSSLVRQLLPDLEIQVGELSKVTGKGTHTTTTTMLYALPDGGFLMDSPGVWEYGLWKFENRDIATGFTEFSPYLAACRFNDCLHSSEPGCGVKNALDEGLILDWRYRSYLRLLEQNLQVF
jgi:ribosome biogenesis GTPase